ncbi:neuronal acetylcholine receptor subunit beta-4-like [Mizuhopecten yessoensis]|uniref:neuronal acetylcholine receptor subunit beta-4-like n=1 Tax=Mizuhopecten yessoensis TaxID=6573 RepID=UPI000B459D48|nr:neuronal acetylcholine receptor subunit beta-4-like [Mizuhopecten yessoensis]
MMVRGPLKIILQSTLLANIAVVNGFRPPDIPYSKELETQLRTELFRNYSVLQRPEEKVMINVSLSILTINDMSIKDQTLSMTGYLSLKWKDERLAWDELSDYDPINFLFSTETYVWRPSLLIDNAVHGISIISDVHTPMRIRNIGAIHWSPADIYTVSCESDIMYYPLDIQTCSVSLTSWAYTSNEIDLVFDTEPVDLDTYTANGEWELIATSGSSSGSRSKGDNSFSNVKFSIKLRRRPLFHVLNTLFPVALMAVLSAMVFKLPVESGEKIGFALTVLLAYAVYLTLISDNIPSTSVSVCFLSIYLSLILTYGTLSVLCTIMVINVHSRPDEEYIPNWLRRVTISVFMPMGFWKGSCSPSGCCKKKVEPKQTKTINVVSVSKIKVDVNEKSMSVVEDYDSASLESNDHQLSWQIVSQVLDAMFFNVFMWVIVLTSIVFFGILSNEFANI